MGGWPDRVGGVCTVNYTPRIDRATRNQLFEPLFHIDKHKKKMEKKTKRKTKRRNRIKNKKTSKDELTH